MSIGLEFWSDVVGALGAVALFQPAAAVNRIRKSAAQLDVSLKNLILAQASISSEELAAIRAQVKNIQSLETSWSRSDERLLWFALIALLVSFSLKILHHVYGP